MPRARLARELNQEKQFVADLLVIAGGNSLLTAGWDASERASAPPSAIALWDLRNGERLRMFEGEFLIAGVTPDERVLWAHSVSILSWRTPGHIFAWDLSDGRVIARLDGHRAILSKDRMLALVANG